MEISPKQMIPRCKRVSFQDNTELSFLRPEKGENSNVEISEFFPNMPTPRSILRQPGSRLSFSPKSDSSKRSKERKKMKKKILTEEKEPRKRHPPLLPSKEPTESLAHALLRAMTHREPSLNPSKPKVVLPKLKIVTNNEDKKDDDRLSLKSPLSNSSRGRLQTLPPRNCGSSLSADNKPVLPEIIATPRDTNIVTFERICGPCERVPYPKCSRKPAAGFCTYCDEYLCANCVANHRGRLTKLHPVIVFHCHHCKDMSILIRRGSGYCIECKRFYCPVCVVAHCTRTNHDVLEGKDLLDVTDAMIGR